MLSPNWYFYFAKNLQRYDGNYLEIGTYDGEGISILANLYPEKKFYAVDPFISDMGTIGHTGVPIGEVMEKQRELALERFAPSNMKLFEETSLKFAKRLDYDTCVSMNVDCVLVDGAHNYLDACIDLSIAARLIQKEGLIVCDDVGIAEVGQALADFQLQHSERIEVLGENAMRYRVK